jgi:hypothetical protein
MLRHQKLLNGARHGRGNFAAISDDRCCVHGARSERKREHSTSPESGAKFKKAPSQFFSLFLKESRQVTVLLIRKPFQSPVTVENARRVFLRQGAGWMAREKG